MLQLMQPNESQPRYCHNQPLNIVRVAGDVLSFIIPCLMFMEVTLIGRLFVPEIVLACLLPVLLYFRAKWLVKPLVGKIIFFALLWLCAQIVTDVIRQTPLEDWSRGWSKIVFFQLNFIALYLLLSKRRVRILFFSAGIAAGQILTYFLFPSAYAIEEPWKFGLGIPITLLFVLLSQTTAIKRLKHGTAILISVAALLNLLLGFRSLALICVATIVYLYINQRSHRLKNSYNPSKWLVIKLIILFVGIGIVTAEAYKYADLNGWLREKDSKKYIQQSRGKYGVLLTGRPEFIASSVAILDSPFIGHGSWAKDPKYTLMVAYLLSDLGYTTSQNTENADTLIPSHSYLFGAWVESGIIGAAFWGWVWLLVMKALWKLHNAREKLLPLAAFICFNMLWDILFSPFGATGRMYEAYHLVFIIVVLSRAISKTHVAKIQSGNLRPA